MVGFLGSGTIAHAEITLLLEEPFGSFGGMNPTGHSAIYLSRVCAASPLVLRPCTKDEPFGVVVSRYHRVGGYDWIAIPLIPYLYAVDRAQDVPREVGEAEVNALRDKYRRKYLEQIVPDERDGSTPSGDWIQLVGSSYDRAMYGFGIETTEEQDAKFIRTFNSRPNEEQFNLLFRNCADFARHAINFYYPRAIHRSLSSDVGIMTPKQAAKCLVRYAKKHPQLRLSSFVIPQIPGTLPRSRPVRGVLESLLKSKRYILPLAPLAVLHPLFGGGLAVAWIEEGHFNPRQSAEATESVIEPDTLAQLGETDQADSHDPAPPARHRSVIGSLRIF